MNITVDWLNERSACKKGIDWFKNQSVIDSVELIKKLILKETWTEVKERYSANSLNWGNGPY